MGKFDKLNQELVRVNNAQGGPNAAALDDRFQLLNNTLVNTQQEWEDYVARRQQEQEALDEYSHGRGNRSYLREGMADGSYQAGMAAAKDQRTTAQKRIDKLLGVDSSQVTGEKTDWGKIAKGAWYKGADQFSTSMVGGLNWLFGDAAEQIHSLGIETINGIIGGVNSLTGANIKPVENKGNLLTNWYETLKETKAHNEKVFAANANSSKAAQIVDNFGTSFVAAVPMALEALMTAPYAAAKAGATATTAGLQYVSGLQAAKGMEAAGMMARQSASTLMQNPQFWSSYVQAIGDSAENAEESGMSPRDAAIYTMINGFFNAAIEVGGADETLGGIQNFPMRLRQLEEQGGKKAVVEWFKDSVLGEGLEEVAQGIFERGVKAPATGAKVASLDPSDTDAIFNPWTSAQEFTGGAVVGGLLGGGQTVIQGGAQKVSDNRAFKGDAQILLDSAKQSGGEQYAAQIREIEQAAKGKDGSVKLNRGQARQLYDIIESSGAAEQYRETVNQKATAQSAEGLVSSVFADGDIELTDQQRGRIMETMSEGNAGIADFAMGTREAYEMGERGATMEETVQAMGEKYGLTPKQARTAWGFGASENSTGTRTKARAEYGSIEEFSKTFDNPQEVKDLFEKSTLTDVNEFAEGFQAAYDMGRSGVGKSYLSGSDEAGNAYVPLDGELRTAAYEMGRQNAQSTAGARAEKISGSRRQGNLTRVKGVVRGEGVSMADLRKTFNDRQNTAYRLLTRYAETTGVNIVLYQSQADENGQFPEAQGRFQWKDNTIYLDINSGLNGVQDAGSLGQYTMMRVFAHEFTHFIEKWNPTQYNEFREFVFATLEERGENVHDLIEDKQRLDSSGKMSYEQASREVVADGMMDILPDSRLVQQLAQEHQTIFQKLLQKMREFAARLRQHYQEYSVSAPREAEALKANSKYLDGIVKMWDEIAKGAVENYQGATGEALFDQPGKPANLPRRPSQVQVKSESNPSQVQEEQKRAGMDFFRPVQEGSEAAKDVRQQPGVQRVKPVGRERFGANDLTSEAESGQDIRRQAGVQRVAPAGRERFAANDLTSTAEEGPDLKGMVPRAAESAAEDNNVPTREDTPEGAKLRERLEAGDTEVNGLAYEIFGMGSTTIDVRDNWVSSGMEYRASIRQVDRSSGVPVYNAREIYRETFPTREAAIDALVTVAENNHFLEPQEEPKPRKGSADAFANGDIFNEKQVKKAAKTPAAREIIKKMPKEETPNGRHDGTAEERKAVHGHAGVDEGSERVRSRNPGREAAPDSPAVQQRDSGIQEHGNGGEGRVSPAAPDDRAAAPDRDGRDDRNGNGGGLQSRGHESSPRRKNGRAESGIQRAVPLKPGGKQNARNYRIEEDIDSIRPNFKDNYEAIKLVKKLIAENRPATEEERAVLAKYKGWGGLKNYILDPNGYYARQLKSILTPEEYETARDSVLNAHYTSTKVISGIYKAVQRMGFKGGNILEPSMGVGNFFGMLPKNLSGKSALYGVELDKITGTIAKNLYPDARIDVAGFQDVLYGDNTFDLVVGNVPFSNDIKIPYRGGKFNLHDFFFVKALDETRPGGVLALITSTGTLDKLSGKTQAAIAERANMIAAFRLPDNAFLANAGTSVTTDLIFLQKKGDGIGDNGVSFTEIGKIDGIPINEYYVEHPENILGELAYETGMYASERTVVHATKDFEQRFNKALESLPKNIMDTKTGTGEAVSVKKRGEKTRTTFAVTKDGAALVDSEGNQTPLTGKQANIVKGYAEIKGLYFNTSDAEQRGNIQAAEEYRKRLNKAYDAFTAKYGTLEANKRLLGKDDEFLRVSGLEIVDKENNVSKSAIFDRPTMYRERKTSAATSSEGLSIVLNETGRVDVEQIARLTGKTIDETVEDLEDEIILTPDGIYELLPQYLSGNIYQKLDAVKGRKGFERQEELLKSVLPKPKTARDIDAEISSHWIPPKYIAQFIKEQFQPYGDVETKYIKELGRWDMQKFYSPIRKWATSRVDAFDLLMSTLNNKRIAIYDTTSDGGKVFNAAETKVAQSKQNDLRSAFREWVFKDEDRRADLEGIFNRTLNAYAPMNFDAMADKIDFGIDPKSPIKLRDYQKSAVARIVFGGNTLLHHGVGTGKTATMIAAAHVLKSTGVAHKPMFVVPNGKTLDFKREILRMYPGANVLALDADMLTPKELRRTKALIATNDWDYVLIHKTGFQKIGVSPETTASFIEQQLEDLETAIRESGADEKRGTRFEKSLITKKKNLEEKLKKILEAPRDDSTTFETMGVDALFVDEAHNFKKVGFATTQSISGVDSSTNVLTTDLYMKENWLRDRGGRIVLATATPITNTVSEMYNMTLHVNPDILREAGVYAFDGWLNTFGDLRSDMEIASDGKTFRMKERIQDFKNGNELISLYRQFADVKQTKDVVKDLPEADEVTVVCEGSDYHRTLLDTFAKRMESVGRGSKDDNALNVNNDARAAATDLRMVSGLIAELFPGVSEKDLDLPDSKINKAVSYIVDEYHKSKKNKGTQLVFLDSGMGRGKATRYKFNLYGDLIGKLVKNGIPRKEIADIGDYTTDDAKQKLYDLVNAGTIRVLIGSTAKMGEGVNVQNKIVALHDLSVPMRADNLEQRHGRGIRHGNENKAVRIYKYIQEQSYDSYLWQMIERKSKYMAQALNGGDASDLEEIATVTVNAQQSKALATGNPAIMEKFKLEDEVNTLRTLEKAFNEETREAARRASESRRTIAEYEEIVRSLEKVNEVLTKNRKEDFELTVGKTTYDNRKEGAAALFVNFIKDGAKDLGSIYGLKISKYVRQGTAGSDSGIVFNGNPDTFVQFGDSAEGNITRLLNGLDRISSAIAWYNQRISSLKKTAEDAEKTASRTAFPKAQELNNKLTRLEEINRELGIKSDEVEFNVTATENSDEETEESTRQRTVSDREVLRMAAGEIDVEGLSDGEKDALRIFNEALDKLQEAQEQREELGRQYREQQFTKGGSRTEAAQTLARMNVLDSKVKTLENRLLSLENKDVLKRVLQKARAVVEAQEKARGKEALQKYREKRDTSEATKKYRERVRAQVMEFAKFMTSPSNKDIRKHVPAELQKSVVDFLESINLASKTALRTGGLETTKADDKYLKTMKKLKAAIKQNVDSSGLYSGFADLPEDFMENFDAMIERAEELMQRNSGEFVVNQMSAKDLKELSRVLKVLKQHIQTMNVFHNNAMFQHVDEAGESSIEHLGKFRKSRAGGTAYKFLRFDYMRPSMAFDHFGEGGRSIVKELQEGQAEQAFLANEIIGFAKKTYSGKEVKAWSEDVKTFTLSDGKEISLPVTHIMSLYCLNKRAQALTHIYGDGIRVANYKEGGKVQLDEGHIVTMDDVQKMVQSLTPRQFEVADALQKYMSTECAKWGNHVSMKRFGVEQFGEENYFPINSDGRYLPATADESPSNSGLYALLNMGFTKELKENAKNRIILYNIFDVFANHTASMTQYRAFALPVLDALRWFNYKNDATSVRDKLSMAFGAPEDARAGSGSKGYAESFVIELLRAYNGTAAQGDPYDTIGLKMLHRFNGAQIAYNLRVLIQQPTSIARAAMILSPAKLTKGLGMSITQMRKLADEMEQHSGIAAWKALGFYDTNISRGLTDLIKQNPTVMDKVMDVGTIGAEQADRFTWAAMWYAAKDSVKRSEYSSEDAYWKAVTDLFEETIYKTQVVDSILTKAEFLRAKGGIARQLGSFMSEPSATMSMLADAWYKYTDDMQQGKSRSEAWQRNGGNIAKTAAVYAVSNVILAAVQSVMDALRDDDEYDRENWLSNFLQKYAQAFKGNIIEEMLPFGKVPIVSEMYEVFKSWLDYAGIFEKLNLDLYGSDISSGLSMYLKYIDKTAKIIMDKTGISGNKSGYTNYGVIYNLVRGVSNIAGIPAAAAMREVVTLWNNTVGFFAPNKKLVTYERAADRKKRETYPIPQQAGMSQATYYALYDKADVDGDGIEQGEFGPVLLEAIKNGEITEEQAAAAWKANWNKENSTTFEKWRAKNGGETAAPEASKPQAEAPKPTPTPKPQASLSDFESFKKSVSLYGDKKEAAYRGWENEVKPLGVSLDSYVKIINAADAAGDGNGSVKQDEMGMQLVQKINRRELTYEQAEAIWHTIWNGARSKTFYKWYNG